MKDIDCKIIVVVGGLFIGLLIIVMLHNNGILSKSSYFDNTHIIADIIDSKLSLSTQKIKHHIDKKIEALEDSIEETQREMNDFIEQEVANQLGN